MPRIISDELFDSLMECVKAQRLLGVMGKLERLRDEAKIVESRFADIAVGKTALVYMEVDGGPKTDNN